MDKKLELQSRREFFKKSAKQVLPILGLSVFGPSILTSCSKDDEYGEGGGCSHCRGNCSVNCGNTCRGNSTRSSSCKSNCTSLCISTCKGNCYGSARDSG